MMAVIAFASMASMRHQLAQSIARIEALAVGTVAIISTIRNQLDLFAQLASGSVLLPKHVFDLRHER